MNEITIVQNSNWAAHDKELQDTLQGMVEEFTDVYLYHHYHVLKDVHEYTIYSKWYGLKTRADFEIPGPEHNIPIPGLAMICLGAIFDNLLGKVEQGFLKVERLGEKVVIRINFGQEDSHAVQSSG